MHAWYECHYLIGTGTEAGLLVELLSSRAVLLQCSPGPLNDVRGLDCRYSIWHDKAPLYFRCKGRGVLLGTEGALRVSIDCYDAARTGHLELEISVVWHRVELSECGSFE